MNENKFRAARRASDLTVGQAGEICGITRVTYQQREISPGDFRLSELRAIYQGLTETAKPIFADAVSLFIYQDC